ncbi:hypothetical protein NEOLEDRAFT_1116320 [Neolentinus lepideus HHB14362 ss-1]|uniref:Uncharacterized protein n=1 Tax=Neolentinus lepideus HHB14362 ss-1 TaxID=1314782 RepID=A0A165S2I4_9AGAM|nr:hypothetical protein NEOLEDRAFT_1116320 [Neolentinus lepideus HHB14362 ss-1]
MIPLVPTLALAFVSFVSSVFVILRVIVPILPPGPFSRRVPPSEFGLPNFGTLSPADKSHLWLASLDIVALAVFVWQAVSENLGGASDFTTAHDPSAAVRLWFSMTLRQACLLTISAITLLHVRMGRPVSFGAKHWVVWAPTMLLVVTSTAIAGVLASTGLSTFFLGLTAYSATIATVSSVALGCLVGTLIIIRRNLTDLHEAQADPWPPVREVEEKPRPSFATEDVDALRDGSSWITSDAGSHRASISTWSFSTRHSTKPSITSIRTPHPLTGSYPSIPPKSSFWFKPATPYDGQDSHVPPVPPLPSPYRSAATGHPLADSDPDPFRRHDPLHLGRDPRSRMGSQTSWLTESSGSKATLSAWSFPTATRENVRTPDTVTAFMDSPADVHPFTATSRPATPALANAKVLGGYGYSPEAALAEKGVAALVGVPSDDIDISVYRAVGWMILIWVPLALSLPYLFMVSPTGPVSPVAPLLLVLSVTLSSPCLALNLLLRSPLPIPSGLFDSYSEPPSVVMRAPSPQSSVNTFSHEYKRSGSVTVVEGRRSTDVWLAKGEAVEGKSKIGRALEMLNPKPKLSILPIENVDGEITPPLPIQYRDDKGQSAGPQTPCSAHSGEMGRLRTESKASTYLSREDSVAFQTRIMVAQRHYSAIATTVVVPPSPDKCGSHDGIVATGAEKARVSQHLRSRSVSSVTGDAPLTPPPTLPLPPTPPSVKCYKKSLLRHRKSRSSGLSMSAIGGMDVNEIDALSAGVLPLLVPGLKVGDTMKIRKDWKIPQPPVIEGAKASHGTTDTSLPAELGGFSSYAEFSSPEVHSTPVTTKPRTRKGSGHKRNHFSLPSLSLGKDGAHTLSTWRAEFNRASGGKAKQYVTVSTKEDSRRNTVLGADSTAHLKAVEEEDEPARPAGPDVNHPPRSRAPSDVPNTARSSMNTMLEQMLMAPLSAASTATLFEFDNGSGPQAESTPPEHHRPHPYSHETISSSNSNSKENRRSSIVYIKSENSPPAESSSASERLARFGSRVVKPLRPKASKLQARNSAAVNSPGTPGKGLRPLSLLQEVDTNLESGIGSSIRPLTLGKRQEVQKQVSDENADPSQAGKGLKPLKLARSDTNKERAALRKAEVLPNVVVRPPSGTTHTGFAHRFR